MTQEWQVPAEIKLVPSEPTPANLFVCSAKIKSEAGAALKKAFETGASLPKDLEDAYNKHLIYAYELGEKNSYWAAGPATDFTEILYIFSAGSLEEAQKLLHDDPFYKSGIYYDDDCFAWEIHSPLWKTNIPSIGEGNELRDFGILPTYPPEVKQPVIEVKVEITTPKKLIASFAKWNTEPLQAWISGEGKATPAFIPQHLFNRAGPGGMGPMGYDWASGPDPEHTYDLTILAVSSMEMAKLVRENDATVLYGVQYDCRYFEWCIHMPLRKASPQHKEALKRFLKGAGVKTE